jgi:hypothetical protein
MSQNESKFARKAAVPTFAAATPPRRINGINAKEIIGFSGMAAA